MPPRREKALPDIAIIGAGTLATALAVDLHRAGYNIAEIASRDNPQSRRRVDVLAKRVGARGVTLSQPELAARITWICVPDDAISGVAQQLAAMGNWHRKIVLHSSGALVSGILAAMKARGAAIASVHPLMTFVSASDSNLNGVPFAMEGDAKALSVLGAVVRSLGGKPLRIGAESKAAYHAFGFFSSPALVALIAAAQHVGKLAGFIEPRARELMEPIIRQTIDNCFRTDPGRAFSGPLRRGDVATIRKHLDVLKQNPELLDVYRSLGRIALKYLPNANSEELRKLFSD
jgi:predicted short-subunit dehydrogenase-like oxidoreductase (DUF2520 family)